MSQQMCYFMDLSIGSIVPYFDEENQQLIETCPTDVPLQQNTENEETILSVNSIAPYFDEENRQTETLIETCPTKGPCHQNRDQLQSVSMIGVRLEDQSDLSSILTEFPQGDQQLSGVIGQEEFWFAESLESEEFWIDQLPCEANDCVTVVSTESVRETQNMQRFAQIGSSSYPSTNATVGEEKKVQDQPTPKCGIVKPMVSPINKGACDKTKMFVRTTLDKRPKKLCCPFCLKLFSKIARHMEDMHKTEDRVKQFMRLPKGSKERHAIQNSLRKEGAYIFGGDSDLNKFELIVCRKPSQELNRQATDYTVCPYCLGYYSLTNLRNHSSHCDANPEKKSRLVKTLAVMMEGRIHNNASTRLVRVISLMRQDEIVSIIRYDWLLIVYGNKMCCKYTPHYQENMIRARLRLNGRLLQEIKKIDSVVTDYASIYHVERYDSLVAAIKVIGRFNPETNEFGAPAMASCAVTFVKLIGKYLCAEYIRLRDRDNKIETEDFLTYMDTDIAISINKLVTETQAKLRRRKIDNIPTMDDVKLLMTHINTRLKSSFDALSKCYSVDEWTGLAELIVAWIIVFNRRRVGEVQNITVEEFLCRQCIDDESNQQILSTLSEGGQSIARKFKRLKIRGKLGRSVPVLVKPIVDEAIKLLLSYRMETGISSDRKFLFELPESSSSHVRCVNACAVLRDLSISCGASNPTSLRGTTLRKHIATTCISLELNETLVSEVARYMGHDDKIHYDYYRKNPIEREIVQMAQILEAAVGQCDFDGDDDLCNGTAGQCGGCNDNCGTAEPPVNERPIREASNSTSLINEPMDFDDHFMTANGSESAVIDVVNEELEANDDDNRPKSRVITNGCVLKKKFPKKRWTAEEVATVKKVFALHLRNGSFPKESEIREQQAKHPILGSRTWQQVNAWISNQKIKKK